MTRLLINLFALMCSYIWVIGSVQAQPSHSGGYSAASRERDSRSVNDCQSAKSEALIVNERLACFRGLINERSIKPLFAFLTEGSEKMADPTQRKTLVIDSLGGELTSSLDLGRRIHRARVRLIVSKNCHSSCANYIVPAAYVLVVWDKSFILMHGSAPRDRTKFILMDLSSRNISIEEVRRNPSLIQSSSSKYPSFYRANVVPETEYFGDIGKPEYYLHRYWDVDLNIRMFAQEKCKPPKGMNLVVGPQYVEKFLTKNIAYFWWPENSRELFDVLTKFLPNGTFVLDLDMFPSWIPGKGFVEQSSCLASLPPRNYSK